MGDGSVGQLLPAVLTTLLEQDYCLANSQHFFAQLLPRLSLSSPRLFHISVVTVTNCFQTIYGY
jgi:hypothetical protein